MLRFTVNVKNQKLLSTQNVYIRIFYSVNCNTLQRSTFTQRRRHIYPWWKLQSVPVIVCVGYNNGIQIVILFSVINSQIVQYQVHQIHPFHFQTPNKFFSIIAHWTNKDIKSARKLIVNHLNTQELSIVSLSLVLMQLYIYLSPLYNGWIKHLMHFSWNHCLQRAHCNICAYHSPLSPQ